MTTDLKIITKNERLTEVKKGNKIIFSILKSRPRKDGLITFNSFDKTMLGIVSDRKSFDECLNDTFTKLNIMNEDFRTRLISI